MSSELVAAEPVELQYTLTSDDWLDAFVAQRRSIRRPWLVPLLAVAALVPLVWAVAVTAVWELSARAIAAVVGISVALAAVIVGLCYVLCRLIIGSRWLYRWYVWLIQRGNPWLSQPIWATVTGSGVHVRNSTGESRTGWLQHRLYVETDRSFVLLASERTAASVLVLPKRGLIATPPSALRAILDAYSSRW